MKGIFKLGWRDLIKGAAVFVISAVLTALTQLVQNKGLSLSSDDLLGVASVAVVTLLSYLTKNLLTDENDKIIGKL